MISSLIALTMTLSPMPATTEQVWTSSWGVLSTSFSTPGGPITVYLPQDMRGGDKVSGSIIGARNNICVEAAGVDCDCENGILTFEVPRGASSVPVRVLDSGDRVIAELAAPIRGGDRTPSSGFHISPIVQEGGAIYIAGAFDGDRKTTAIEVNGRRAGVMAETPRGCIVSGPAGSFGPYKVDILEGDRHHSGSVNLVQLRMVTPKKITTGKKGKVALEVLGLQGLPESAYPLEVEVRNYDTKIARFEGDIADPYRVRINPADVRNGVWSHDMVMRGRKKGEYKLSGYVYSPGFPYASGY